MDQISMEGMYIPYYIGQEIYEVVDATLKKMDITPSDYMWVKYILRIQKLKRLCSCIWDVCLRIINFFRLLFTYPQRRIFKRKDK